MGKATFNSKAFLNKINTVVEAATKKQAEELAREVFSNKKKEFLDEFINHPISQEISDGPTADSNVLTEGNLFSFIGFNSDDNPIEELYNYFNQNIRFINKGTYVSSGSLKRYVYNYSYPNLDGIKQATILNLASNWAPGRSWVLSIERGFPGLDHYYYNAERYLKTSRSGHAMQIKGSLGYGTYKRRSYISQLLKLLQ